MANRTTTCVRIVGVNVKGLRGVLTYTAPVGQASSQSLEKTGKMPVLRDMIGTDGRNNAMADISVDARGLSCPEPVLLAKKAIEQLADGTIEVLVDTATGMENVSRMANTLSCAVQVTDGDNGNFILSITKE